jgi:hypothetical protein
MTHRKRRYSSKWSNRYSMVQRRKERIKKESQGERKRKRDREKRVFKNCPSQVVVVEFGLNVPFHRK